MNGDRDCEQPAKPDFAGCVANADGHTLWNAMNEERPDEKCRQAEFSSFGLPGAPCDEGGADKHPGNDADRRTSSKRLVGKREDGGRHHHAAGCAAHDALPAAVGMM